MKRDPKALAPPSMHMHEDLEACNFQQQQLYFNPPVVLKLQPKLQEIIF